MQQATPDKIKITCPQCKSTLSVNRSPGIENKALTCPVCKYKAIVSSYMNSAINVQTPSCDAPTEVGGKQTPPPIPSSVKPVSEVPVCLKVNGVMHPLKVGSNSVGRKAKSGTADIQIAGDKYMSRNQGIFYVEKTLNGFIYKYQELGAANHSVISGVVLEDGDVVAIKVGDVLLMGDTSVQLCECFDEDKTQIR